MDYEKEENGRTMEENDLAEPTLQVRMLEREDSAAAVSDSTQLSISSADYQVLLKIVEAEAGSEDLNGRILVANVVLNRVKSELFPDCDDRCGVSAQQRCLSVFPGKKRNDRHCFNQ